VEFFLNDLYGPHDFTQRDQDVTRAWSSLKRTLPARAAGILARAIELDVLTTELDHAMAAQLPAGPLTNAGYASAYRAMNRAESRRRQIVLTIGIGEDLDRIVRHAWIGVALKAAHLAAHAAGLGALQDFLERGYTAFRRVRGAERLLTAIRERETELMNALFSGTGDPLDRVKSHVGASK
jgi:hypothetical protein